MNSADNKYIPFIHYLHRTEYDIIFRNIYTATEIWSILRLFSLSQGQD